MQKQVCMSKDMMVKLNGCIFWLKMMTYRKNIILFKIESVLILKKNLIAKLPTIKFCWKPKSNHACLAVIRVQIHWEREKVIRHITDDLESHSDDSDEE